MNISKYLTDRPNGKTMIASIGLLSFALATLFSNSNNVWWDKGLTELQSKNFTFIGFFSGFLLLFKFILNIKNWNKKNKFPRKAKKYIIFGIIGWLSLLILVIIQRYSNFFPGWFLLILYFVYFTILFINESDFNTLFKY